MSPSSFTPTKMSPQISEEEEEEEEKMLGLDEKDLQYRGPTQKQQTKLPIYMSTIPEAEAEGELRKTVELGSDRKSESGINVLKKNEIKKNSKFETVQIGEGPEDTIELEKLSEIKSQDPSNEISISQDSKIISNPSKTTGNENLNIDTYDDTMSEALENIKSFRAELEFKKSIIENHVKNLKEKKMISIFCRKILRR